MPKTKTTHTKRRSTPAKKRSRRTTRQARVSTNEAVFETDSTYFLKLVVFVLLGTLWLKFGNPMVIGGIPLNGIPLGLLVGIFLVHAFEKHQSDRKIWYACLLVVTIISYFVPAGILL